MKITSEWKVTWKCKHENKFVQTLIPVSLKKTYRLQMFFSGFLVGVFYGLKTKKKQPYIPFSNVWKSMEVYRILVNIFTLFTLFGLMSSSLLLYLRCFVGWTFRLFSGDVHWNFELDSLFSLRWRWRADCSVGGGEQIVLIQTTAVDYIKCSISEYLLS